MAGPPDASGGQALARPAPATVCHGIQIQKTPDASGVLALARPAPQRLVKDLKCYTRRTRPALGPGASGALENAEVEENGWIFG